MNKKLKVSIIVIVAILVIGIGAFAYFLISDLIEEGKLKDEINNISYVMAEGNFEDAKNMTKTRVTKGDYLKVEDAAKNYLAELIDSTSGLIEIANDERLVNMLTADNYIKDGPEFTNTKSFITEAKNKINESKEKSKDKFTQENMMSHLDQNLDSYYVDLYKELMGEADYESIETSLNEISNILENSEKVIKFLVKNKDKWSVQNNTIIFTEDNLISEYNSLLSNMSGGVEYTKDFGTYTIDSSWEEYLNQSTDNEFFYVKVGTNSLEKQNNIFVKEETNSYSESNHINLKNWILSQLSNELSENDTINANAFTSDNGYTVYEFEIHNGVENVTNNKYYIIGDYKHILVNETVYTDSENVGDVDDIAREIVNTFKWND